MKHCSMFCFDCFKVEEMKSQLDSAQDLDVNVSFVQARAVHYWNKAIELLEKLEK